MTGQRRVVRAFLLLALALGALAAGACTPQAPPHEVLRPKVEPPAIKTAGTLRVGVDLSYPPFAGVDGATKAGIDVDVAQAMAARLGLEAEIVDVKPSDAATALEAGDADVVLSAPYSADVITRATIAGTYISDGPGLFASSAIPSRATTASVLTSDSAVLGAQQDSPSYWLLVAERGADEVHAYPTLREAFAALARGEVNCIGADSLVGAYLMRDAPSVHFVGALAPAHVLGAAVAADNMKLSQSVRSTLDSLAADGVLDAIRRTWVGALAKLPLPSVDTSQPTTSTITTP